jgi:hypothetical protein
LPRWTSIVPRVSYANSHLSSIRIASSICLVANSTLPVDCSWSRPASDKIRVLIIAPQLLKLNRHFSTSMHICSGVVRVHFKSFHKQLVGLHKLLLIRQHLITKPIRKRKKIRYCPQQMNN